MADWTTELPGAVSEGDATHVADHNAIVSAIAEARNAVDAAEGLISSLEAALDGKAASSHQHAVSQVTGLQAALDGKAASSHQHTVAQVTGLQAELDGKAESSHQHTVAQVTGLQAALDGKQASGSYATTAQVNAKADASALADLEARVEALETPEA